MENSKPKLALLASSTRSLSEGSLRSTKAFKHGFERPKSVDIYQKISLSDKANYTTALVKPEKDKSVKSQSVRLKPSWRKHTDRSLSHLPFVNLKGKDTNKPKQQPNSRIPAKLLSDLASANDYNNNPNPANTASLQNNGDTDTYNLRNSGDESTTVSLKKGWKHTSHVPWPSDKHDFDATYINVYNIIMDKERTEIKDKKKKIAKSEELPKLVAKDKKKKMYKSDETSLRIIKEEKRKKFEEDLKKDKDKKKIIEKFEDVFQKEKDKKMRSEEKEKRMRSEEKGKEKEKEKEKRMRSDEKGKEREKERKTRAEEKDKKSFGSEKEKRKKIEDFDIPIINLDRVWRDSSESTTSPVTGSSFESLGEIDELPLMDSFPEFSAKHFSRKQPMDFSLTGVKELEEQKETELQFSAKQNRCLANDPIVNSINLGKCSSTSSNSDSDSDFENNNDVDNNDNSDNENNNNSNNESPNSNDIKDDDIDETNNNHNNCEVNSNSTIHSENDNNTNNTNTNNTKNQHKSDIKNLEEIIKNFDKSYEEVIKMKNKNFENCAKETKHPSDE